MENQEQKPKKKLYKRWWFWPLAIFLFLIILGSMGDSSSNDSSNLSSATSKTISYKVGEVVPVDKTSWKVVSARNLGDTLSSSNEFIDSKKTSGKYVKVSFEVTNNDKTLQSVGNVKIIDSQNREFSTATDVSFFIPSEESLFIIDNINPGITKKYTVIFDIPKDAVGLKLQPGGIIVLKNVFIDLGI